MRAQHNYDGETASFSFACQPTVVPDPWGLVGGNHSNSMLADSAHLTFRLEREVSARFGERVLLASYECPYGDGAYLAYDFLIELTQTHIDVREDEDLYGQVFYPDYRQPPYSSGPGAA